MESEYRERREARRERLEVNNESLWYSVGCSLQNRKRRSTTWTKLQRNIVETRDAMILVGFSGWRKIINTHKMVSIAIL